MRVQVIQHVPFEGLGNMRMSLEARGAEIHIAYMFERPSMPDLEACDLLILMGGPMSVHDEAEHPWLREEKVWLKEAVQHGVPCLGVCLGAQLLAEALGGEVTVNQQQEIGWFDLQGLASPPGHLQFPQSFRSFHWHGDTFSIPPGAVQLARNQTCENQAFQYGQHVIGLQFHLETTVTSMHGLIDRLGGDLQAAPTVQTPSQMKAEPNRSFVEVNSLMAKVLDYLLFNSAS